MKNIAAWSIILVIGGVFICGSFLIVNIETENNLPKEIEFTIDADSSYTLKFESNRMMLPTHSSKIKSESSPKASELLFHLNPHFLVWLVLALTMLGISFGIFPFVLNKIRIIKYAFLIPYQVVVAFFLVAILVGILFSVLIVLNPYLVSFADWIFHLGILFKNHGVLNFIIIIPTIVGLSSLIGILLIYRASLTLKIDTDNIASFKKKFTKLKEAMKFFLTVSTTLITFAVFTSATLRIAILHEVKVDNFQIIPIEFIYLYGLQFTIVLAIFYLPISYQLKQKGIHFISFNKENNKGSDESFSDLSKFIDESTYENFKVGLSILAPLISSILPDVLHF